MAIASGVAVILIVASAPGVAVVVVVVAGVEELDLEQPERRKQKIAIKQRTGRRVRASCRESLRATDFFLPRGPNFERELKLKVLP